MNWKDKLRGFYAVLDRDDPTLAASLLASSAVLQIRLKDARPSDLYGVASWVRPLTAARGALLVIDDHLDVALAVGADAVHLGQSDLPLPAARRAVARSAVPLLVGVSTHDLNQVAEAVAGGADYLGFGPVFATSTKANPEPVVGLAGLAGAVAAAGSVPVVAIGGITPELAARVAATGAAAACAIRAVNRAEDVKGASRRIAGSFAGHAGC